MTRKRKAFWLKAAGYLFCVLPPVIATLEHFPLWIKEGKSSACSALGILVLLLCLLPFRKGLKAWFSTPSAWKMWLVLWVLLYFTRHLTAGLLAVATVAFPTSILGALLFHCAKTSERDKD